MRTVFYWMQFRFADDRLRRLYREPAFTGGHPPAVAKGFRKAMGIISAIPHEGELGKFRGLSFERLKGNRDHQFSARLNDQFRLILEIEGEAPKKVMVVIGIEDYH